MSTYCVDEENTLWVGGYNNGNTLQSLNTIGFDDDIDYVNKLTKIPNFSNKVLEVQTLFMFDSFLIDENRDVYIIRSVDEVNEAEYRLIGVDTSSKTYINKLDIPEINGKAKYLYNNSMDKNIICLTTDNKLYGFGRNTTYALGIGDSYDIYDEIRLLTTETVDKFYSGLYCNLFINKDGKLFIAGVLVSNKNDGSNNMSIFNTWTDISDLIYDIKIKDICFSDYNIYIVDENDNLWEYGPGIALGVGEKNFELDKFIKIDQFDGKVKKLLKNNNFYIFNPDISTRMMIIDKNNNLWVTGFNKEYNLGLGHNEDVLTWTQVTKFNGKAKDVFMCQDCSYCLDTDNNLWACGGNARGACGTGTLEQVKEWTKVKTFECGIKSIENCLYTESIFIIDENYNIWVCGDNLMSTLGIGKDDECITEFTKYIEE